MVVKLMKQERVSVKNSQNLQGRICIRCRNFDFCDFLFCLILRVHGIVFQDKIKVFECLSFKYNFL